MLQIARQKLGDREVELVCADLLQALFELSGPFAAVGSTYALHHLEADEKESALRRIGELLLPGGVLAVGDLGFRDAADQDETVRDMLERGYHRLPAVLDDEYFWQVLPRVDAAAGWASARRLQRFSDLSIGFCVVRER